ncbi:hypothetical protein DSUL_130015 [Desulfovibrionales bacterium]
MSLVEWGSFTGCNVMLGNTFGLLPAPPFLLFCESSVQAELLLPQSYLALPRFGPFIRRPRESPLL